ncbi:uncharacterized protein LOC113744077 isoform X4 [Larimichthys crocea]|uniref:uncharacterized protein LOC113744077 isoform X4 n=1 Tax=Larimichthys crocea TaxID=215358 RepID=UPI000F5F8001|nr:uncharacterized protein LOC113744077 isoform X4 [Larimichthys crocea]
MVEFWIQMSSFLILLLHFTGDAATTMEATTMEATSQEARADCSVLDYIMLVMRVAELLLITVITVLLIRARGNQRPPEDNTVNTDEDEDDGVVKYEN